MLGGKGYTTRPFISLEPDLNIRRIVGISESI